MKIIFSGDSHFAVPLNDYLDDNPAAPGYSIAAGGDSLRESFAKVRYVLERNHGIDTLILTADPHMFGKGRLESSNRSFADSLFHRGVGPVGAAEEHLVRDSAAGAVVQ